MTVYISGKITGTDDIEITDDNDELSKRGECHKEDGEKEE